MGNNSVPKFIFRLSRFPVYRGSVLGRFYCSTFTKVQLHVSAINVGHLQVVHETLKDKLYLHVSGEFTVCGVGWGGCEISLCV